MTVSLSTSCGLLFNLKPKVIPTMLDLVAKDSMDSNDLVTATDLEDSLANIKGSALPEIQPFIEANRQAAQDIIDMFGAGGAGGTRDLQDFRAAGLELINRCAAFIEG